MNARRIRFTVAIALLIYGWGAFASGTRVSVGEVRFLQNSAAIPYWTFNVAAFACPKWQDDIDAIVVTGNADASEDDPQALSVLRAENVKKHLLLQGLPEHKIHLEGVGARLNVGPREFNRRVDLEMHGLSSRTPNDGCRPAWGRQLTALPLAEAVRFAHEQVDSGVLAAHVPAANAIVFERTDLLEAFLVGAGRIALGAEDRTELMRVAIMRGNLSHVQRLIAFGITISEFDDPKAPLDWAVCGRAPPQGDETHDFPLLDLLLSWGSTLQSVSPNGKQSWGRALSCAARQNRLLVADYLLARGANPDQPVEAPPLIESGAHSDMVRFLLRAGADPRAQNRGGETLFHVYKFTHATEVGWLAGLGLDINARKGGGPAPIEMAVRYAPPEVLAAFVAHGAALAPTSWSLIRQAGDNLPGLLWLIDHGAPLDDASTTVSRAIQEGDRLVVVIDALHRRGFNLRLPDRDGDTPLRLAIRALAPEMVERLVTYGAVDQQGEAKAALVFARQQEIRRRPPIHSGYAPWWDEAEERRLNAEDVLAARRLNKARIIDFLSKVDLKVTASVE